MYSISSSSAFRRSFRGLSILMLLLTACSTPERILRTATITATGADGELALVERLEFVELSRQKQYILRYRSAGAANTVDITGNLSWEAKTLPPEQRRTDFVARFDDTGRLHFREAKIIAGVTKGFYGYDVLKIRIRKEGGGESTWEVDPRWGPVLYRDDAFGINRRLILDAVDSGGNRLGELFRE
jgi:hypothetical protein